MQHVYIANQFVPGGGYHFRIFCFSLNDLEMQGELPDDNPVLYFQVDAVVKTEIAQCKDLVWNGI